MPRPSRPFQLHSPASPQVRGYHRASEWVSVATVAMAVERVAEGFYFFVVVVAVLLRRALDEADWAPEFDFR